MNQEDANTENFEQADSITSESSSLDNEQPTTNTDQPADDLQEGQEHQQADQEEEIKPTRGEQYKDKITSQIEAAKEERRQIEEDNAKLRDQRQMLQEEIMSYSALRVPSVREIMQQMLEEDPELSESEAIQRAQLLRAEMQDEAQSAAKHILDMRMSFSQDELAIRREYNFMDENDKDFDPEFTNLALEVYEAVGGIQRDVDGKILNARIRLKPFIDAMVKIREQAIAIGQKQNRQTIRKQMASANPPSGGA